MSLCIVWAPENAEGSTNLALISNSDQAGSEPKQTESSQGMGQKSRERGVGANFE